MEMSERLEDLAQLCRDFIDLGEDKDVWQRHLETLEEVMATLTWMTEVKRLLEELEHEKKVSASLWGIVENYDICYDCYTIIDLHEPPKDHIWDGGWSCKEQEMIE
jgi:hypothetical protein